MQNAVILILIAYPGNNPGLAIARIGVRLSSYARAKIVLGIAIRSGYF